jgi:hypothetical protein
MGKRLPLVLVAVVMTAGLFAGLPAAGAAPNGLEPQLDTRAEALQWIKTHGYLPLHGIDALERAKAKAAAYAAARGGQAPSAPSANGAAPIIGSSWQGVSNAGVSPADPNGAIGPSSYIEIINQNISIYNRSGGLITTATLTLNGPAVGCPAETTITPLGTNGSVNHQRVPSGQIVTYNLPTALSGPNGVFGLYETTYTIPNSPFSTEVHINKCKGLVQAPAAGSVDGCYISSGAIAKVEKVWMTALTAKLSTPTAVSNAGRCYAPPAQGPWYINVKFTYASCKTTGNCGWHAVWKDYSSY